MLSKICAVAAVSLLAVSAVFAQTTTPSKPAGKPVAREIPNPSSAVPRSTVSNTPPAWNGKCGTIALTPTEVADILERHNKIRTEVKLAPLSWDCRLADMAQTWANRGVFEHRSNIAEGENIFVSSNGADTTGSVVTAWLNERNSWNSVSSTCAAGKVCTHYTQLVWRKTATVGCGINRNASGKWKMLVVCNYSPAGNSGGPPY